MTALDPQPGDWVLIRAQVVAGSIVPEEILVQLRAKIGPYATPIRREEVLEIVPRPREPHEVEVTGNEVTADGRRWVSCRCPDCDFACNFSIAPTAKICELLRVINVGHQETV